MCLLTFVPADTVPNVDALLNGAAINTDGHGFAIVTGQRIIVQRGMDAEGTVEAFARLRALYPAGPALFHSRMATHGTISDSNIHPFLVGGDSRTVLAHNGILPKTVQPQKGDTRSDTRILAEDILPHDPFGSLGSRRNRDRLGRWLTWSNKLVVLTVDPRYRQNAYILNEEQGVWDGGVWYSNEDYRPSRYSFMDDESYWEWWENTARGTACGVCLEVDSVDPHTWFCRVCGTCADCGEEALDCMCYTPTEPPAVRTLLANG